MAVHEPRHGTAVNIKYFVEFGMDEAKADEPGSADDREILEIAKLISPAFEVLHVCVVHASMASVHLQPVYAPQQGRSQAWIFRV
jgi:hypothetical protein